MRLEEIDKNFKLAQVQEKDVKWIAVHENKEFIRGVYFDEENDIFRRVPKDVAESVNAGVAGHATKLAGGRICFQTNSPYIVVKCLAPFWGQSPHMTLFTQGGCAIREDGDFKKMISPTWDQVVAPIDNFIAFEGIHYTNKPNDVHNYDIYLPLYGFAKRIYIGVKEGSKVEIAPLRKHEKPVVFYGSSITQGGCATRPDNDYVSIVSRWLDTEYVNLGFSGSAHGEQTMADYIASFDSSVIVVDYDHNSGVEELRERHYPFYRRIRQLRPDTPIVFISKPDYDYDTTAEARISVIKETCKKARRAGDKNIAFINGKTLFGKEDRSVCTVDTCHPNDIGFYRMAKTIYPVLKKLLEKQ